MKLVLATLVGCLTAAGTIAAAQQPRAFYVTVTDEAHKPVTGLGAEDFALKDGGARQPIITADPATAPLAVVIASVQSAPSSTIPADEAAGIVERLVQSANAENVTRRWDTSAAGGQANASSIVSTVVIGATSGLLSAATDRRAVVVIVNGPTSGHSRAVVDELRAARASLWVVDLAAQAPPDDNLAAAIAASGGLHVTVPSSTALGDAARDIAMLLTTSQYLVTATIPVTASGPLPLATRHDRGIVLTPAWSR